MEAVVPSVESSGISFFGLAILPLIVYILISIAITVTIIVLIVRAIKSSGKTKTSSDDTVPSDDAVPSEPYRTSLAQVLRNYRIRTAMTQEMVAEKLCVSRQAVSKWESGKTEPSTSNLIAIAALYQIPPEEILRQVMHE